MVLVLIPNSYSCMIMTSQKDVSKRKKLVVDVGFDWVRQILPFRQLILLASSLRPFKVTDCACVCLFSCNFLPKDL